MRPCSRYGAIAIRSFCRAIEVKVVGVTKSVKTSQGLTVPLQTIGAKPPDCVVVPAIGFYRAGHAHPGVLTLLAVLLQIAVDYAAIPSSLVWPVRVGAVAASILVSGGFFAVAHRRSLRIIPYTGAVLVAATTLTVGVGLIRSR